VLGRQRTGGSFDPTVLGAVIALGYDRSFEQLGDGGRERPPPSAPGDSARPSGATMGCGDIVVDHDRSTVTLPAGIGFDPGGIGKGLAADLVCEFALAAGAWGVMAEVGGDIAVAGQPPEGVAWRLGVENPFDTDTHSAIIRLSRGALATSSQRKRRFTTADGERHHLIDPAAHTSAVTTVQTVSVIAATGARAETLTKPGFLRNTTDYLDWLPSVGAAGLVIDENGIETMSSNWGRYL